MKPQTLDYLYDLLKEKDQEIEELKYELQIALSYNTNSDNYECSSETIFSLTKKLAVLTKVTIIDDICRNELRDLCDRILKDEFD